MKGLPRIAGLLLAALLAAGPARTEPAQAGEAARGQLVREVRAAANARDYERGERLIEDYRRAQGVTPQLILALSWLGRGAQAAADWERAERYAAETRRLALEELKKRPLDADEDLPLALGASIEVEAHALAARGARREALRFLDAEWQRWRGSSMEARIQKNIHLLGLAGQPAPPLEAGEYIGARPAALAELRGRAVLLFFWAHWCGDCKQQAPILERVQREFGPRGLVLVGPTQRYGYVARGAEAAPAEELAYIAAVRSGFYGALEMSVPVSEQNFQRWGASTTPTLVVLDRAGVVQLYHPGRMSYEALAAAVARALESPAPK